ncbi:MAG TPA: hypothetical protein VGB02_06590 [Pyrinomonadaceae bacterium]|jgi:RNA recognition motif-containing protein
MEQKIYVGNLLYSDTEEDLHTLFARYGKVHSTELVKDRMTGRSKGFGFVVMNEDGAEKAIAALHNSSPHGRMLTVNKALPREDRPRRSWDDSFGGRSWDDSFALNKKQSEREMIALGLWDDQVKLVTLTPDGKYRILDTE